MDARQLIERSIIKKYRKSVWCKFIGGIKDYELISPGDRIAVCISGGKDSMLMAKCFQHLQKYSDFEFDVEFIAMDPGYAPENLAAIKENAELLGLPMHYFRAPIFDTVEKSSGGSPCYLCARMRRGYLYREAQNLGCNKIALGHHFDDFIETTLMSMFYGAEIKTMMPKLHSQNFEGMELIRPMCLVKEKDIIAWANYNSLSFLKCACAVTRRDEESCDGSKRREMKELIKKLREENDNVDMNIFKSMCNVNLATVIGYKRSDDDEVHLFTENYDRCERD